MDVGVGSFVFSLGIVSTKAMMQDESVLYRASMALWKSLSIILLGVIRVIMTKGVDYPV